MIALFWSSRPPINWTWNDKRDLAALGSDRRQPHLGDTQEIMDERSDVVGRGLQG